MSLIWHLIKFNFIFHRMRLLIISIVCFVIVVVAHFFNSDSQSIGEDILSYSSSLIFFVIVGKMSLKNNSMFDIKHLLGLPLSKSQIVLQQSIADLVHFFPVSFVWIYGLSLMYPEYHLEVVFLIFHVLLVMLNMMALNKRIDFARIQHASASFKNSFLFLNKYLNINIQVVLIGIVFAVILAISKNIVWREYAFFILTSLLVIFAYFSTLKMLKDESLSYFIAKRDIKRMGWKFMVVSIPMVLMFSFQRNIEHADQMASNGSYLERIGMKLKKYTAKMENKADLLKLASATPSELEEYIINNKEQAVKVELMGGKLPHMIAGKGNLPGLKKLIELEPNSVDLLGTIKQRTPLFTALNSCHLKTAEYLLSKGANINHQDIDGNTPIMFSAKSGCLGGVLLLKERGADTSLKNKKKEKLSKYITKFGIDKYWNYHSERNLASQKKSDN